MSDVVVFAGTTEGYEICSFLAKNKVSVLACVATDYGSKSLKEDEYLKIHAGRLNGAEMENLLKKLSPGLVLDATHPYAAEVTENIRDCLPKYRFFLPASIKRGRCLSG